MKEQGPELFGSPKDKIQEATNQILQFKHIRDFDQVRALIAGENLVSLEKSTGLSREELEREKPGVCDAYNKLILELKDPSLTQERFQEIMKEGYDVTH